MLGQQLFFIFVIIPKLRSSSLPLITISTFCNHAFDHLNETVAVMTNYDPKFQLRCTATYPIEWIFHDSSVDNDGISGEFIKVETRRLAKDFINKTTYIYTTRLRFHFSGKLLTLTNFTCQLASASKEIKKSFANHVIMTAEQRKTLLVLRVSENLEASKDTQTDQEFSDARYENCPNAVALVTQQKRDAGMPCWKCVSPKNNETLRLQYEVCDTPTTCSNAFHRINHKSECLQRVNISSKDLKCMYYQNIDYNPKTVLCKNYGLALVQTFFFGVYQGKEKGDTNVPLVPLYMDWTEIDPQKMIFLHRVGRKTLYTGENIVFTCEYSRYYFALGSWFGIEHNGKTEYVKANDTRPCEPLEEKHPAFRANCTVENKWRGTYNAKLFYQIEEVGKFRLYCIGPVWNSTEWVNTSRTFKIKEGKKPRVISLKSNVNQKTLVCQYEGNPVPNAEWILPNLTFVKEISKNHNGKTSVLQITKADVKRGGNYTCYITNILGHASKSYIIEPETSQQTLILVSGLLIFIFLIAVISIIYYYRVIKSHNDLTEEEVVEFLQGNPLILKNLGEQFFNKSAMLGALPFDVHYHNILKEEIMIDENCTLGSGEYGTVFKGKLLTRTTHQIDFESTIPGRVGYSPLHEVHEFEEVAVKVCKSRLDKTKFKALMTEVKVLAYLGTHDNIVGLIGAVTENIRYRELFVVSEYCHNGSLDTYLRNNKSNFIHYANYEIEDPKQCFTINNMLKWACEIADGLEFMHGKRVIHGDLAIRNVLLTKDYTAKIGDFGLSRQLMNATVYKKKTKDALLPWQYMAYESLKHHEFSAKSDVYSFGVTLWELFSFGEVPFSKLEYTEDFVTKLGKGLHRLPPPKIVSNELYDFMRSCRNINPASRPEPRKVKTVCKYVLSKMSHNIMDTYL